MTSCESHDSHHFCSFVDHNLSQKLLIATYAADRGYDDGNNHLHLQDRNLNSAISLKDNRTKKKDSNKQIWLEMVQTAAYKAGRKERYKIERKFGEAKQGHGLGRCRNLGILGFGIHPEFSATSVRLYPISKAYK